MNKLLLIVVLALTGQTIKAQSDAFITTWVTATGFETLTLPAQADAPTYSINWGDGTSNNYTKTQVPSHTYFNSGAHTISFTGTFTHLKFVGQTKLKAVQQWGTQKWTSMANMFEGCLTLNSLPTQSPDLSLCTNISYMFWGATAFDQPIGSWDVSKVTNMSNMFNSKLTTANYDTTLIGWASIGKNGGVLKRGVTFSGGSSQYCNSLDARNYLINIYGWKITDGGANCTNYSQQDAFITTWQTTAANETLTLPAQADAPFYTIVWGDGSVTNTYTAVQAPSHKYLTAGDHTLTIFGNFTHLKFYRQTKLKAVQQWGTQKWTSMANMFEGCSTLNSFPTQAPDLSLCTDISKMFSGVTAFNHPIGSWDVSKVTNMNAMFAGAIAFNQDISSWDVSNVTNMREIFHGAESFNQPIGSWNVSNVTDMIGMFNDATAFNQPLGAWNVSKVTSMNSMFFSANAFNQPLGSWDVSRVSDMSKMFTGNNAFNQNISSWNVSNVRTMSYMFNGAAFNQPIGSWNVSNVIDMTAMFSGAAAFNQDISSWNVSKVSFMSEMFSRANAFNQPIGSWNVSSVINMNSMFSDFDAFNQDISSWNVSSVRTMSDMFRGATSFNQPIGSWNVSKVIDMSNMFWHATSFNQPLGAWDVSNVTDMINMFNDATAFNQALGSWNVSKLTDMSLMFANVKLSTANYDATLIGWAIRGANGGTLKTNVTFYGGNSTYCNSSDARNYLINTYGWNITDGGLNCASLGTEAFDKSSTSLYPNPTSSVLNVTVVANIANQPYTINDALGKIVLKGRLNEGDTSINVEHLSKGIYFIKVANNEASKFIKE